MVSSAEDRTDERICGLRILKVALRSDLDAVRLSVLLVLLETCDDVFVDELVCDGECVAVCVIVGVREIVVEVLFVWVGGDDDAVQALENSFVEVALSDGVASCEIDLEEVTSFDGLTEAVSGLAQVRPPKCSLQVQTHFGYVPPTALVPVVLQSGPMAQIRREQSAPAQPAEHAHVHKGRFPDTVVARLLQSEEFVQTFKVWHDAPVHAAVQEHEHVGRFPVTVDARLLQSTAFVHAFDVSQYVPVYAALQLQLHTG